MFYGGQEVGESEGSCMWVGACMVCTFLQYQRREYLNFLSLSGCEAEEGGGVVGLEGYQWSKVRNGVRVLQVTIVTDYQNS